MVHLLFFNFASGFGSDCLDEAGVLYMNDTMIPHGNKKRETGRRVWLLHIHMEQFDWDRIETGANSSRLCRLLDKNTREAIGSLPLLHMK